MKWQLTQGNANESGKDLGLQKYMCAPELEYIPNWVAPEITVPNNSKKLLEFIGETADKK